MNRFFTGLFLGLITIALVGYAPLSERVVADGSRYYRDATTGTSGAFLKFPNFGLAVQIKNEDTTNALLVRFVRSEEADPTGASLELTAPADETWTQVQSISAGETITFDIRRSRGFIWDRAAGSGAFTVRLID